MENVNSLRNDVVIHFFKNDIAIDSFEKPLDFIIDGLKYTLNDTDHAKYIIDILAEFVNKYKE